MKFRIDNKKDMRPIFESNYIYLAINIKSFYALILRLVKRIVTQISGSVNIVYE